MTALLEITQILQAYDASPEHSPDRSEMWGKLFPLVYDHLKAIATREKRRMWQLETMSATALVNEAYLKLAQTGELSTKDRAHFFAVAAMAMRQILVNYLEHKQAQKRGGDWQQISLDDASAIDHADLNTLLAVNRAVEALREIDAKLATTVEMRFFAGMTESEMAIAMECTERTVRRNWSKAKALLQQLLTEDERIRIGNLIACV
jgi:RNA polymerase sigma factor (TIGR02999 family)